MREMMIILFGSILVNNFVLTKLLGISPVLVATKKPRGIFAISSIVFIVMLLATALAWPLNSMVLIPANLGYLSLLANMLIILGLVMLIMAIIRKSMSAFYESIGEFLPMIASNSAVLGIVLLCLEGSLSYAGSMMYAAGAGVGYLLAMLLYTGVYMRLESGECPKSFEGLPITLIALSIAALSLLGFSGVIENIIR